MMKAARFYGPGDVRIEDVPEPGPPGPGDVLIKVSMVGLCGTDAHHYLHPTRLPRIAGPVTMGHEVVGHIVAMGPGVTTLRVGQRVVPGAGWWCGQCPSCKAGHINICDDYCLYGIQDHGGLAEYATFPAKMCHSVVFEEDCPDEVAILAQPLAIALHALRVGKVKKARTLALFGLGGLGSLLLAVLLIAPKTAWLKGTTGPQLLIALDVDPAKRDRAMLLGEEHGHMVCFSLDAATDGEEGTPLTRIQEMTGGVGVDLAIEASGAPGATMQALAAVRKGGTVLQVGIPAEPVVLPIGPMVIDQKRIVTANGHVCQVDLPEALYLLAMTKIATQIETQIIGGLEDLVEHGLLPLAHHTATKKLLVDVSKNTA